MIVKRDQDAITSYLEDSSNIQGGYAEAVFFPESEEDVRAVFSQARDAQCGVTISGKGTGTTGGRVPFGGFILATDKLDHIHRVQRTTEGAVVCLEPGVTLGQLNDALISQAFFYPPDPTETTASIGGTVATNASGSRSFKYGPTRNFIERVRVVLASGETLDIRRGMTHAMQDGDLIVRTEQGTAYSLIVSAYELPRVKHAAGYFIHPGMDAIDLFIGSEGTLGFVSEIELSVLPVPEDVISIVAFFTDGKAALSCARKIKERSVVCSTSSDAGKLPAPRSLEYLNHTCLDLLREDFSTIPSRAVSALYFEQECRHDERDHYEEDWLIFLEQCGALVEVSWMAFSLQQQSFFKEFRHALPEKINARIKRNGYPKIGTDLAVPSEYFEDMHVFYKQHLEELGLDHYIFGHIGDNHLHVNILPSTARDVERAQALYKVFARQAISYGGTISAEHGVGKLRHSYLEALFGKENIRAMAAIKKTLDPTGMLGRGTLFPVSLLE